MRKYRCEIWITRKESFYVEADSGEKAKEKFEKNAAEKKKPDEEITGKYIHEVYNKQERDSDGKDND